MTDLSRLTEALEQPLYKPAYWPSETTEDYDERVLAWLHDRDLEREAARLVVDGKPGWYCEPHEQWSWNDHACWAFDMGPDPCRMVAARLIFPSGTNQKGFGYEG